MNKREFQNRTKLFALRIVRLYNALELKGSAAKVIGKQMLRSGTSVGANYRAACLGKSERDFLNKLKICEEEADETIYWLELLIESQIMMLSDLASLLDEARQITAILTSAVKTTRGKLEN